MDVINWGYFGLFSGSFVSATLVPFPSEGLLVAFFGLNYPVWICVIVASIGNTLGGLTNYFLGKFAGSQKMIEWLSLNEKKIANWKRKFSKYGYLMGLIAWVPIVGDPMLLALGFLKVKFWPLLFTVFVGKALRYAVIALVYLAII